MQQAKNQNIHYIFKTRSYRNFLTNESNYNFPIINTSQSIRLKYNSRPNSSNLERKNSLLIKNKNKYNKLFSKRNIYNNNFPKITIRSADMKKRRFLISRENWPNKKKYKINPIKINNNLNQADQIPNNILPKIKDKYEGNKIQKTFKKQNNSNKININEEDKKYNQEKNNDNKLKNNENNEVDKIDKVDEDNKENTNIINKNEKNINDEKENNTESKEKNKDIENIIINKGNEDNRKIGKDSELKNNIFEEDKKENDVKKDIKLKGKIKIKKIKA